MEAQEQKAEQGIRTRLGFRDISFELEGRILEVLKKYDVIKKVSITKEKTEVHKGKAEKIHYFKKPKDNPYIRGRIFPLDELVNMDKKCDIVIQNWKPKEINPINVDVNIYHNLKIGEQIPVKISGKGTYEDPSFKIFNGIIGYIETYENPNLRKQITIETEVLVEVKNFRQIGNSGILKVKALKLL